MDRFQTLLSISTCARPYNWVIQKFMTQEDTNNNLKQLTKEAQGRIDSLNEDKEAIRSKLEAGPYYTSPPLSQLNWQRLLSCVGPCAHSSYPLVRGSG